MNRISGPYLSVSSWEWAELMKRVHSAPKRGTGERTDALRRIAVDYGISVRTIHRYLRAELTPVKVGRHRALFLVRRDGAPSQVTAWEAA